MYPNCLFMGNLHSSTIDEDAWTGDGYFKLDGRYDKKQQGKVESALKEIFLERLKAKQAGEKAKNQSYKIIINCFSEDTDVMTVDGIKKLKDCKVGDLVYSLNIKTEEVEIKPIEKMYEQEYRGNMIHFNGKNKDLLVTPEHKMLFQGMKKNGTFSNIQKIEAKKIINRYKNEHT